MKLEPTIINTSWELLTYALLLFVLWVTASEMDQTEYMAFTIFVFIFKALNLLAVLIHSSHTGHPLIHISQSNQTNTDQAQGAQLHGRHISSDQQGQGTGGSSGVH